RIRGLRSRYQGHRRSTRTTAADHPISLGETPMRRSIPLMAVALSAALTLTACSTDAEPEEPAEEPMAEETEAPAGGDLTVWVDETRQAAVESAAAAYESETGGTVETVLKN